LSGRHRSECLLSLLSCETLGSCCEKARAVNRFVITLKMEAFRRLFIKFPSERLSLTYAVNR
ncbi:MAG TPA: hypothetical protein VIS99_07165, partial [Terrimicrobiaceae bacterium]